MSNNINITGPVNIFMSSPITCANECSALILKYSNSGTVNGEEDTEVIAAWPAATYYMGQENFDKTTGIWTCPYTGLYTVMAGLDFQAENPTNLGAGIYFSAGGFGVRTTVMATDKKLVWNPVISFINEYKKGDQVYLSITSGAGVTGTWDKAYLTIAPVLHKQIITSL